MGRRSTGPRYWASKGGWYVTHHGKRHLLVKGGKEKYDEAVIRWKIVTGQGRTVGDDDRRDLIRLGMLVYAVSLVLWERVKDDVIREEDPVGLRDVLDVVVFRYYDRSGDIPYLLQQDSRTLAEGQSYLVDRVGVIPGPEFNLFTPLRRLREMYPPSANG